VLRDRLLLLGYPFFYMPAAVPLRRTLSIH
jgi:hypothetical protein